MLADTALSSSLPPCGLRTPVEEVVTYAESQRQLFSDFLGELSDRWVVNFTQVLMQVLSLCIHQLQNLPTEEALEWQDQEQLRDQMLGVKCLKAPAGQSWVKSQKSAGVEES
eukprot:g25079.t1